MSEDNWLKDSCKAVTIGEVGVIAINFTVGDKIIAISNSTSAKNISDSNSTTEW